jgi:hypothetical protein
MISDGMVAKESSVEVLDVAQIMLRSVKRSGQNPRISQVTLRIVDNYLPYEVMPNDHS